MTQEQFEHVFGLIEIGEFNPFSDRHKPYVPLSDPDDCSGEASIEMFMPDGHNIVTIEFDFSYASKSHFENGWVNDWTKQDVSDIKVYINDDDYSEIPVSEKLYLRIEEYLKNTIPWLV